MKKSIVAATVLLLFSNVLAQETELGIEEVEIQGKILNLPFQKVAANVEIITREEIQKSPAKSIDELLQQVTGLDIRRRGSNGVQSDVSIRGGSFEQVLILINGIRMNDSQTGHNSLNIPVDLSSVERIEIIKGPAARRFGQSAYTGAINIITKVSDKEKVKISAEGGDYSTYRLGLNSTFGTEKIQHLFQINSGASDGYRHNTDYKIQNLFYQNSFKINHGSVGLQAGFQEKKFGANGFYASPLATEQYEETQASVVALRHQQNFEKFSLKSNLYWRRGQDMYLYIRDKPEVYRNMHIGNNIGGEISGSYQSNLGTTALGVELRKEFLTSNNLGERNRFLTQVFFEHHFSLLNDKLQIIPGVSWANYSDSGNFFYPGVDVGYQVFEHHEIYGNIAKVHRIPTFTDLYYVSRTEEGNPNLKPESALSYEIGYRFAKHKTQFKISYFGRDTNDAIDWTKANLTDKWKAENIGNTMINGLETEISQSLLQNILTTSVSYTYIDNKISTSKNFSRYALDNLKHQFAAKVQANYSGFYNEWAYRYLDRMNGSSFNLLDTKLGYTIKNFETYVLVNNVINTEYTETFGVPMPKRWFHVGVSYTIQ